MCSGKPNCNFQSLDGIVKDSGSLIDIQKGTDLEMDKCESWCESVDECFSIQYCKRQNKCYFFDKKLNGFEEVDETRGCITSYKKCKSGNNLLINC